nr:immunoglobulin light chain junction region [Macaca mulatta]MOW14715.1 immunoglobulin light chain junction region [Macaca mulatta]
CQKYRSSPFIF